MDKVIKGRIGTIKKRCIPSGYCRTKDIGVAPEDWTLGKVSDVVNPIKRAVPKPDKPYWRLGIKSWAKGTFHAYVDEPETVDMDELYEVHENDLVVNITFAWEHAIAIANKDDQGLLVSHRFPTYEFKNGQVPDFYKAVITQKFFKDMLDHISPGGAGRNRVLNQKDFLNLPCYIPPIAEQKKIAGILDHYDKLIKLCEAKVNEYKSLKKTCLSKMFPRNGSNVPELRFPGFTEAWEQRKLGEVVDVRSGKDYKHLSEGNIPVYGTGGYMLSVNQALSYDEDAVGIGRKGTIDKPYVLKAPFWTVDTLFYAVPKENFDLGFTYCIFQNIDWKKKDESTGVPSLSKTAIESIDVLTPDLKEQQTLSSYFAEIDNLITLHQREVEEYTKFKKAMTQLLLTGIVRV